MTPTDLLPLANHLWQSSLCVALAWLITIVLKNSRASVRYGVWLASSVKFLIPLSLLVSAGGQFGRLRPPSPQKPRLSFVMEEIGRPFAAPAGTAVRVPHSLGETWIVIAVLGVWLCGFIVCVLCWFRFWRDVRGALRGARHLDLGLPIPVVSAPTNFEPGVFGIFRPVMLLPEGIAEWLAPEQLDAIVAHELSHVRRGDNLTAAIHMGVEAIFWFHPLVWLIRGRLTEERETACDEEVLGAGNDPDSYAESILNACRYYRVSPLACVSGATGADLRRRIERIAGRKTGTRLNCAGKSLLAAAGAMVTLVPFGLGLVNAPLSLAQTPALPGQITPAGKLEFEVASVKPNAGGGRGSMARFAPGGRFNAENVPLRLLVRIAYDVNDAQISGGPGWIGSDPYDIAAKAPEGQTSMPEMRSMLQALLIDRFKLGIHRENKEAQVYELTAAKGGAKLTSAKEGNCITPGPNNPVRPPQPGEKPPVFCGQVRVGRGLVDASGTSMTQILPVLSQILGRPVVDKTGYTGMVDFHLTFTPDESTPGGAIGPGGPPGAGDAPSPDQSGPSIFAALQEQMGLRLESAKGQIETLVIDHVEKPLEN